MREITYNETKIVMFMNEFILTHNQSPSYKEIQEYFGFKSVNSVFKKVHSLIKKGKVSKDSTCRSLRVL
jgi:repressor LexA